MKRTQVLFLLLITLLLLAFTGCTQEPVEEVEALAPDAFSISLEPVGHWHVFSPKTLLFTVTDTAADQGVAGLDFSVQIAQAESDRVREQTVADGDVVDEGDGVYALEYTPSSIGAYSVVATFVKDEQHFASAPTVFEVAKAGEEGIKASVDGNDYVYQIRYHVEPGHIHANDSEPVKMVFELMRGVETGDAINWEQPWTNTFDHVNVLADASFTVTSEDGSISETIPVTYKGRGIYEAQRVFSVEEVGEGREYTLNCTFTDAANNAQVSHEDPFHLHASGAH